MSLGQEKSTTLHARWCFQFYVASMHEIINATGASSVVPSLWWYNRNFHSSGICNPSRMPRQSKDACAFQTPVSPHATDSSHEGTGRRVDPDCGSVSVSGCPDKHTGVAPGWQMNGFDSVVTKEITVFHTRKWHSDSALIPLRGEGLCTRSP